MRKTILAGDIKEGMKVWVQGNLMEVKNVRKIITDGVAGTYFNGYVDKESNLYKTGYNGAVYGSIDIYIREIEI